jgi:hypothetical protein
VSDTAALLDALVDYFGRYVVLTVEQLAALALWTLHTHVCQVFSTTPYLVVTSAEPRSGKTRLLECLHPVCPNPQTLTALTEAVLFRIVSRAPTLLIDETDSIFSTGKLGPSEKQESLRGILNAGYRKGTTVARCAPGSNEIEHWPVYGPKVLAGIGHLPTTIEDRGLCIRLSRRLDSEPIERFRYETGIEWGIRLMPRIEAWSPGARIALSGMRPELPDELDDRAQDAYEVLIAIGDYAGSEWGERARTSLVVLRSADSTARESIGVRLFRDLAAISDRLTRMERIATHDLLAWLYEHGEEPWEDWWGESAGKKASRRLAMALAEYDVKPEQYKEDGEKKRGYRIEPILAALERYQGGTYRGEHGISVPLALSEGLRDSEHGTALDDGYRVADRANPHGYAEGTVVPGSTYREGSPEWLGQASMDELREWADRERD